MALADAVHLPAHESLVAASPLHHLGVLVAHPGLELRSPEQTVIGATLNGGELTFTETGIARLTPSQRSVAALAISGLNDEEIAASVGTKESVEREVQAVLRRTYGGNIMPHAAHGVTAQRHHLAYAMTHGSAPLMVPGRPVHDVVPLRPAQIAYLRDMTMFVSDAETARRRGITSGAAKSRANSVLNEFGVTGPNRRQVVKLYGVLSLVA